MGRVKNFLSYGENFLTFRHLTAGHMKAARALLDWNQDRLATESGLAASTIKRLENGGLAKASVENVDKIAEAFERVGIQFFNGDEPGVRLRKRVETP
jgi:transcriptional regulator with XRE-family HTH domain